MLFVHNSVWIESANTVSMTVEMSLVIDNLVKESVNQKIKIRVPV